MIAVISPGLLTTVQDDGRFGYAHIGVSAGGAADPVLFRAANFLVGNQQNAPALECTLLGPTLEFHDDASVAVVALGSNSNTATLRACAVSAGTRLEVGPITSGARAYIAVRGGFEVPPVMGSASTFLPARFGGLKGRALRSGDVLRIGDRIAGQPQAIDTEKLLSLYETGPLRVTASLQSDWFDSASFFGATFNVSEQSNRSGLRLSGAPVHRTNNRELLTEGVSLGAIQVPSDGNPIILFVDQQTTGGYPKIANVIAADLHRVAQLRPRDQVRFQHVSLSEALEHLRSHRQILREVFEA